MATVTEKRERQMLPGLQDDEDLQRIDFAELAEMVDEEGLQESDLVAIDDVIKQYVGFTINVERGPQTRKWPDHLKAMAVEAAGGGDTGSVAMSDKLFSKEIECVKNMNEALAAVNRLKNDREYTLPHPRTGLRRVRVGMLPALEEALEEATRKVRAAAEVMNLEREAIKTVMKAKLGARYDASIYDVDFTQLYVVSYSFPPLGVPEALRRFSTLYEREAKRVQKEAAETIVLHKRMIAETTFEVIDHLIERLESRRVLDGKSEVLQVEKTEDGRYCVTYRDATSKASPKPVRTAILEPAEFDTRVTEDTRRKAFKDATAKKIFEELEYFHRQLDQLGIGGTDLEPVFERLRKAVSGYDRETLPVALKSSAALREGLSEELKKVGDAILDLSVVAGKRDILRRRAKSAVFNPEKV